MASTVESALPSADATGRGDLDPDAKARAFAVTKDPLGDRVHAWIAAGALALQPLTPLTAIVGLCVLAGYAVLRLHATAACYRTIWRGGLLWAWVAVFGWITLSLAWSPTPSEALGDVGKLRVILLLFGLWPIVHHGRRLILGLAAGCALNAVIQVLMLSEIVASPHLEPGQTILHTGGLSKHPGMTAVFAAVATVLLLGDLVRRSGDRRLVLVLLLGSIVNILCAGNRTVLLVWPVAVVAALVSIGRVRGTSLRTVWMIVLVLASMVLATAILKPGSTPLGRVGAVITEVNSATGERDYSSSGASRFLWWRESIPIGFERPILGHGAGSSRDAYERRLERLEEAEQATGFRATSDPHATWAMAWVEQGIVGVLLWGVFFGLGFLHAFRLSRRDPTWIGLPAAWLVFLAFAATSSVTMSTYTMSLGVILVAFTIPRPIVDPIASRVDAEASPAS